VSNWVLIAAVPLALIAATTLVAVTALRRAAPQDIPAILASWSHIVRHLTEKLLPSGWLYLLGGSGDDAHTATPEPYAEPEENKNSEGAGTR